MHFYHVTVIDMDMLLMSTYMARMLFISHVYHSTYDATDIPFIAFGSSPFMPFMPFIMVLKGD